MANRRKKPEFSRIRTRDGWQLALYRYRTKYRTSRWGPIVLVHGLGANRCNLDAPVREISLARYLHERGHDVWVVELRGAGRSRQPGWPIRRKRLFDFDDYVQKDVPAFVKHILETTGAPHLHWVGHSMGGMLAYAAMIHFDSSLFRSVVTLGSPAFTRMSHPLLDQVYKLRGMVRLVDWIPYRHVGIAGAIFPKLTIRSVGLLAANPDNLNPKHMRRIAPWVLHDLPSPLLKQFAEWYGGTHGFSRRDGLLGYWEHLNRVKAPVLVVAGGSDVLTPVADLKTAYEALGSKDKVFLVCNKDEGFSADYGHIDLVLGPNAPKEIFPRINQWILDH